MACFMAFGFHASFVCVSWLVCSVSSLVGSSTETSTTTFYISLLVIFSITARVRSVTCLFHAGIPSIFSAGQHSFIVMSVFVLVSTSAIMSGSFILYMRVVLEPCWQSHTHSTILFQ